MMTKFYSVSRCSKQRILKNFKMINIQIFDLIMIPYYLNASSGCLTVIL